jgi:ElaB/YqjD/DUF883 family membrane-anchored ribosome-binding protein
MSENVVSTGKLKQDVHTVIEDAEALLGATADQAGERVKELRGRLATALERTRATCCDLEAKAAEQAKKADHVIREHPYESIGIALGIGLLVGWMLGRK